MWIFSFSASLASLKVGQKELEGGTKRATDPNWSLKVYTLFMASSVTKPDEFVICYLRYGPRKRGFVHEELIVVSPNT